MTSMSSPSGNSGIGIGIPSTTTTVTNVIILMASTSVGVTQINCSVVLVLASCSVATGVTALSPLTMLDEVNVVSVNARDIIEVVTGIQACKGDCELAAGNARESKARILTAIKPYFAQANSNTQPLFPVTLSNITVTTSLFKFRNRAVSRDLTVGIVSRSFDRTVGVVLL